MKKYILLSVLSFFLITPFHGSCMEDEGREKIRGLKRPAVSTLSCPENEVSKKPRKPKKKVAGAASSVKAEEDEIILQKGKGTKKSGGSEGGHYWNIFWKEKRAGKIYINLSSEGIPLIQIFLNKKSQGKGIGRIAYRLACEESSYDTIYAHMRKNNIASRKAAQYAGFAPYDTTPQMVMKWVRKKSLEEVDLSASMHTYQDHTGRYSIPPILTWVNENTLRWDEFHVEGFLPYLQFDTWSESSEDLSSNISHFMKDPSQRRRVLNSDLSFPIVVTNDGRIIDGVHRLFKAIYNGDTKIKGIFIESSELTEFRLDPITPPAPESLALPIPDRYINLPLHKLPAEEAERREIIEDYFSEHLPSAEIKDNMWLISLERPQERYGCYLVDPNIKKALNWWNPGTEIHDIPFARRELEAGLLAIEDQWMPLSWSRFFAREGTIPDELVLIHLDDHQDMMNPRIGERIDGRLYDFITGDSLSFEKPETIERATLSGAIGKGSILIPLIWAAKKIHVRHLCYRPHPTPYYKIEKISLPDPLLSDKNNRISIRLKPSHKKGINRSSSYVVTPDIDQCLADIPSDVPILLHVDMDYFNDRFDGNSAWTTENTRVHDLSYKKQHNQILKFAAALKEKGLHERVKDTSIGISPSFYPGEFWPLTDELIKTLKSIGIKV